MHVFLYGWVSIQVGIAVTCLSVLALLGESGDLTCALSLWGYSAGFDVAFGALALKLWSALSSAEVSFQLRQTQTSGFALSGGGGSPEGGHSRGRAQWGWRGASLACWARPVL